MGEKKDYKFFFGGQEIKAISGDELKMSYETDTVVQDCEITTTHGVIQFKAVFTREQWAKFVEVSEKVGE